MKTLITAAALLVLILPAQASKFRASDRKWLPVMEKYSDLADRCHSASSDDDPVCVAEEKQAKKLEAAGYCLYARTAVGRPSRDRKHCYEIEFPKK
jgi:hypothetical protein